MHCLKAVIVGSILLPVFANASSYQEIVDQLGIKEPEFLVHVNVEKDFNTLGKVLTDVYMEYLKTSPDVPPVPVSYESLFERLGLTNLKSVTISSERVPGGFLNQSLNCFDGEPQGLFRIIGTENRPFEIIESAPADADLLGELTLNASTVVEIMRNIAVDFMGPMGQGMIDAQLSQPLTENGLTAMDVINKLNTRIQVAIKVPDNLPGNKQIMLAMLSGKTAISFQGMGGLLESLAPLLQKSRWENVGDAWQMNVSRPEVAFFMKLQAVNDSRDLLMTFSEDAADWFLSGDTKPAGLIEVEKKYGDYPREGLAFFYDVGKFSELQMKSMWTDMEIDPKYAPMMQVVEDFLMRFVGSSLSVTFMEDNTQRSMVWQPASTKANLGIMGIAVPAGMVIGYGQAIEAARQQGAAEAMQNQENQESGSGSPPQ